MRVYFSLRSFHYVLDCRSYTWGWSSSTDFCTLHTVVGNSIEQIKIIIIMVECHFIKIWAISSLIVDDLHLFVDMQKHFHSTFNRITQFYRPRQTRQLIEKKDEEVVVVEYLRRLDSLSDPIASPVPRAWIRLDSDWRQKLVLVLLIAMSWNWFEIVFVSMHYFHRHRHHLQKDIETRTKN